MHRSHTDHDLYERPQVPRSDPGRAVCMQIAKEDVGGIKFTEYQGFLSSQSRFSCSLLFFCECLFRGRGGLSLEEEI